MKRKGSNYASRNGNNKWAKHKTNLQYQQNVSNCLDVFSLTGLVEDVSRIFGSVHSRDASVHKINTWIGLWNTSFEELWKNDYSFRSLYFVVIQEKKCISCRCRRWWRYFTTSGILSFFFFSIRGKFKPRVSYFSFCIFRVPTRPGTHIHLEYTMKTWNKFADNDFVTWEKWEP